MTNNISTASAEFELPEQERARIRSEMQYAMLVAGEARRPPEKKTPADKVLAYLSNGFVLLLVGSLITSVLVPYFQREYESRSRQTALRQECLTQFLLYSNSIWQEYYAILPATLHADLEKDEYLKYKNAISDIKLKRYDAYAKVLALALVFRDSGSGAADEIDRALDQYARKVNAVSQQIDTWLNDLYCTPTKRESSPCATFDPTFDAHRAYLVIQQRVGELGNENTQQVAGLMVQSIKSSR